MYLSNLALWRTYWECVSRPYTVFICSLTAALCYLWGRQCQVSPAVRVSSKISSICVYFFTFKSLTYCY